MNINDLKQLSTEQYDKCRESALERVKARIGNKPTRKDFERELGALWSVLDVLALVVFVAALVVSSAHIIQHMGVLASQSFGKQTALSGGTQMGTSLWVSIHQWGYIALSEASMILFMTLFAISRTWRRWVFVALALVAAVFVVIANWQSGTGLLESIMPPIFTLGIGFHLERLIVASLKRKNEVTRRYLAALSDYEAATHAPESHSQYRTYLMQSLWDKLISLKVNRAFVDAPNGFRVAACLRELEREEWVNAQPDTTIEIDEADEQRLPFEKPDIILYSNGNGHKSVTEIP